MARVMEAALRHAEALWAWGQSDCCTFACDVFCDVYGIDPMANIRGTYDSAAGAARLVRSRGGMEANVRRTLREAGLVPCEPREGVLGVVTDAASGLAAAAICAEPGVWLVRTETGLTSRPAATEAHGLPGVHAHA
jgi:hypothetical protein